MPWEAFLSVIINVLCTIPIHRNYFCFSPEYISYICQCHHTTTFNKYILLFITFKKHISVTVFFIPAAQFLNEKY